MLWDLIRDFFVIQVFGGTTSLEESYGGLIGYVFKGDLSNADYATADTTFIKLPLVVDNNSTDFYEYITIGDYLSTIATIISISIIVILCCLFIKKIVNLIGGLIR